MNDAVAKAKELRNYLNTLPEFKNYLTLKSLLEQDNELANLRKEIARLTSEGKIEEKENLLKIYNSNPLVNNYLIAREEVASILREIQNILSD